MKKNILYSAFLIANVILCGSCSDYEEELNDVSPKSTLEETSFPIVFDEKTSQKEIVVNGQSITINVHNNTPNEISDTRAIGGGGGETIYERDPNATLATVPVLVKKGTYKKYTNPSSTPFAGIGGAKYVLLRMDKFRFECVAPPNTKQLSVDITNITPQGYSSEGASAKGFVIESITSSTQSLRVLCSFYIQNGAAYNLSGQQLTPNTSFPLPGEEVRYQFTYETR